MTIKPAQISDFETIKNITRQTITLVYPHYYPSGAVDFFPFASQQRGYPKGYFKRICIYLFLRRRNSCRDGNYKFQ